MDASRHPKLPEDYPGRVCGPGERWAPVEQGDIGDACDQNDRRRADMTGSAPEACAMPTFGIAAVVAQRTRGFAVTVIAA